MLAPMLLLLLPASVLGCGFARRLGQQPLPVGHPPLGIGEINQDCKLKGCYVQDPTNTSISNHIPGGCGTADRPACSKYGHLLYSGFIDSVDALASHFGEDMCYWALMTLPPPAGQEENITDSASDGMYHYGSMANIRFHEFVGDGVVFGG